MDTFHRSQWRDRAGISPASCMVAFRAYGGGLGLSTIALAMIATRMTLVSHAPTLAARSSAFPLDEPIDESATRKMLARSRGFDRGDRVWISPAVRAGQTATLLGLSGTVEPALRDSDYGRWAGRTLEDVQASEPQAVTTWLADPAAAPHGGESVIDLLRRVGSWLDDRRRDPGHAIVVTHAAIVRAAIVHALQAAPQSFWRIDIEPLSRTLLTASHNQWRLRALEPIE
jgi:broad specificity phosphatase PhoE